MSSCTYCSWMSHIGSCCKIVTSYNIVKKSCILGDNTRFVWFSRLVEVLSVHQALSPEHSVSLAASPDPMIPSPPPVSERQSWDHRLILSVLLSSSACSWWMFRVSKQKRCHVCYGFVMENFDVLWSQTKSFLTFIPNIYSKICCTYLQNIYL